MYNHILFCLRIEWFQIEVRGLFFAFGCNTGNCHSVNKKVQTAMFLCTGHTQTEYALLA